MIEIRRYLTESGRDVFGEWLARPKDTRAMAKIVAELIGSLRGISAILRHCAEVCLSFASTGVRGYRVYYAQVGKACVLLLCGGDKRKQSADIQRALEYLKDYRERTP